MRKLLICFALLISAWIPALHVHAAPLKCITEFRGVTFYPNGTQEIGRDWVVVNITNELSNDIYNVEIPYRNATIFVPHVAPSQTLLIDPYLTLQPLPFKISVSASIVELRDVYEVHYRVLNNYSSPLAVNISIPIFDDFIECKGCDVKGDKILVSMNIGAGEEKSFTLQVRNVNIPDGRIAFKIRDTAQFNFSTSLDFSIQKTNSDSKWFATFLVSNPFNYSLNMTLNAWAEINTGKIELFNGTTLITPHGNWSGSAVVSSTSPPVFYLKVMGKARGRCEIDVIPATREGGRYVTGYGLLKGMRYAEMYVIPSPPETPAPTPIPTTPPVSPAPLPSPSPVPSPSPTATSVPVTVVTTHPVIYPKVTEREARMYVAITLPATYGLFIFFILPAILNRKGVVVTADDLEKLSYTLLPLYGRRLFSSPSNAFPGCIVIYPDDEMIAALRDSFGLERGEAEIIAVALKLAKPLITSNDRVALAAIESGCMVIRLGGEYGKYGRI